MSYRATWQRGVGALESRSGETSRPMRRRRALARSEGASDEPARAHGFKVARAPSVLSRPPRPRGTVFWTGPGLSWTVRRRRGRLGKSCKPPPRLVAGACARTRSETDSGAGGAAAARRDYAAATARRASSGAGTGPCTTPARARPPRACRPRSARRPPRRPRGRGRRASRPA